VKQWLFLLVPLRDDDGRDGCDFRQITEIPTIQEIVEEQEVPEVLVLAGKVMGFCLGR